MRNKGIQAEFPERRWWPASRIPRENMTVLLALTQPLIDRPMVTLGHYHHGWQHGLSAIRGLRVYAYLELPPAPDPEFM